MLKIVRIWYYNTYLVVCHHFYTRYCNAPAGALLYIVFGGVFYRKARIYLSDIVNLDIG